MAGVIISSTSLDWNESSASANFPDKASAATIRASKLMGCVKREDHSHVIRLLPERNEPSFRLDASKAERITQATLAIFSPFYMLIPFLGLGVAVSLIL